jgi:DNA-binding transcriptional regulator YiaG
MSRDNASESTADGDSADRSPITTPPYFEEDLQDLRDRLGWTQAELGRFFGVSKITAHRWEKRGVGETEARKAALRYVDRSVEASPASGRDLGDALLDAGVVPTMTRALFRGARPSEGAVDEPVDWKLVFGVRDRLGWTQTEFAQFLGVTHSVPAVWESGDGTFGDAIRAALLALDRSSDPERPDYRAPESAWKDLKTEGLNAFYEEVLRLWI